MRVRKNQKMNLEEIASADLAALEMLVRFGLANVVTIDGEPHYAARLSFHWGCAGAVGLSRSTILVPGVRYGHEVTIGVCQKTTDIKQPI
jgi:hypothetical protein